MIRIGSRLRVTVRFGTSGGLGIHNRIVSYLVRVHLAGWLRTGRGEGRRRVGLGWQRVVLASGEARRGEHRQGAGRRYQSGEPT